MSWDGPIEPLIVLKIAACLFVMSVWSKRRRTVIRLLLGSPVFPCHFLKKWCSWACHCGKSRRGRVKREVEVRKRSSSRLLAYHGCINSKDQAERS
jgi:hypothetical protein